MRLTSKKLKKLILEEYKKVAEEEGDTPLKDVAYEFSRDMGLRRAYHGAHVTFDGNWKDLEISVEYHGSYPKLTVYVSPKNRSLTDPQTLMIEFESPEKYTVKEKGGEEIGTYDYSGSSSFTEKIKSLAEENFEQN